MCAPANGRSSVTHWRSSARRESLASITCMLDHLTTANAAGPGYRLRRANLPKGYQGAASAAVFCLLAAGTIRAADVCPAPPKHKRSTTAPIIPSDDHRIRIESDGASLDADGLAVLTGHVQLHQDQRTISADRVTYDEKTGKVTVAGSVDFEDPRP